MNDIQVKELIQEAGKRIGDLRQAKVGCANAILSNGIFASSVAP